MERVLILTEEEEFRQDIVNRIEVERQKKSYWQDQIKAADQKIAEGTKERQYAYSQLFGQTNKEYVALQEALHAIDHPQPVLVEEKLTPGRRIIKGISRIYANHKAGSRQIRQVTGPSR